MSRFAAVGWLGRKGTQSRRLGVPFLPGGHLGGGFAAERAVWPLLVVVVAPGGGDGAGIGDTGKLVLVETLVAHAPVEALHEGIVGGLAGAAVVQPDLPAGREDEDVEEAVPIWECAGDWTARGRARGRPENLSEIEFSGLIGGQNR